MATLLTGSDHLHVGRQALYSEPISIVSSAEAEVFIGSFVAIGRNLKIMTFNHDYNYPAVQGTLYRTYFNTPHPGCVGEPTPERTKGNVSIGNDVWIGDDVTVMSGVCIGDGCCIGAGSIVTRSLAPYTVAAGVPCKVIKSRFSDEVVELLLNLRWWDWDDARIRRNEAFFQSNLSRLTADNIKALIQP